MLIYMYIAIYSCLVCSRCK